jgi:hypothetical protein
MMEALTSSETSALTGSTQHNIQEDGIRHLAMLLLRGVGKRKTVRRGQ